MAGDKTKIAFAFGPNAGYFFEYKGVRKWKNIPQGLRNLFDEKKAGKDTVKTTHCVGLTHDGGYLIIYDDINGEVGYAFENIPKSLQYWLSQEKKPEWEPLLVHDTVHVSFGPEGSYFAVGASKNGTKYYRWEGMGPREEQAIQTAVAASNDRCNEYRFSMGDDGSYLLHQAELDGGICWFVHLADISYEELTSVISRSGDDLRGFYLVMNPYIHNEYFVLLPDGTAEWKINRSFAPDVREICMKILEDRSMNDSISGRTTGRKLSCGNKAQKRKRLSEEPDPTLPLDRSELSRFGIKPICLGQVDFSTHVLCLDPDRARDRVRTDRETDSEDTLA